MEKVVGMEFTGKTYFDPQANNGLGEHKALFVLVKEGHESEAEDKMRAFTSAGIKHGVHMRDGVVAMTEKQIEMRISQIEEILANVKGEA